MYEEPLRMPFVIRYPKEIPAGTRNGDIVTNVDFASLLADYAGAEPPQQLKGAVSGATSRATLRRNGPAACITVTGPSTRYARRTWASATTVTS